MFRKKDGLGELSLTPQKRRRRIRRKERRKKNLFKEGVLIGTGFLIGLLVSNIPICNNKVRMEACGISEAIFSINFTDRDKNIGLLVRGKEPTVVEEMIAEHTIGNPASTQDRNLNMSLAAEIINGSTGGYILKPGEKFSWLNVVGNPTEERGFKKAPVIINGSSVPDWGGGVCQVSSTINSAIQKTDQRTDDGYLYVEAHSISKKKPPAYLKEDRGDKEASVAYSSQKDFWFINTLEYTIRINVETIEDEVTVRIFSRRIQWGS